MARLRHHARRSRIVCLGDRAYLAVCLTAARPVLHPGDPNTARDSCDAAHWAATLPIQIKSVTFADGSTSRSWAVVSDFGGKAEVNQYCPSYGGPFCIYPWYSANRAGAFHYGMDFPDTVKDYRQASSPRPGKRGMSRPLSEARMKHPPRFPMTRQARITRRYARLCRRKPP